MKILELCFCCILACSSPDGAPCQTDSEVGWWQDSSREEVDAFVGGECPELFCSAVDCTDDVCQCLVAPFFCLVDGMCVPDKAFNPVNGCLACDASKAPLAWTVMPYMETKPLWLDGQEYRCLGGVPCPVEANCQGKECGDDGCGGFCQYTDCENYQGGEDWTCVEGVCVPPVDRR
jgi:hypothetical protein